MPDEKDHRFIIVLHKFFGSASEGFEVHETNAATREEAWDEAYAMCGRKERTFSHCACEVIEIAPDEKIAKPRRLSLTERITGRLAPKS